VLWFPKAREGHISKFKQHWFGPYMIQYCLLNNTTFLVIVDKFDPNPILVNINKLKPYQFQDSNAYRGLKSIVKMGRDIANIEIGVNTTILENVQGTCTKFSFSMDGTENKDSIVGTKIQDTLVV